MTNNKKVFISDEKSPFDIISEILDKNGLKENLDDAIDKIEKGETSMVEIVHKLSRELVEEKITEKDFILAVQKQLGTTIEVAQNISKDIKEKLLPLAQEINTEEKTKVISPPIIKNVSKREYRAGK